MKKWEFQVLTLSLEKRGTGEKNVILQPNTEKSLYLPQSPHASAVQDQVTRQTLGSYHCAMYSRKSKSQANNRKCHSLPEMGTLYFYTASCSISLRILLSKQLNTKFNQLYLISRKYCCIRDMFSVKMQLHQKSLQDFRTTAVNPSLDKGNIPYFLYISCTVITTQSQIDVAQKQIPKSHAFKTIWEFRNNRALPIRGPRLWNLFSSLVYWFLDLETFQACYIVLLILRTTQRG